MSTLTTATSIALLLAVLKVGDVVLTPGQQRAVQRFCDDLTLRLEYANIEHVYRVFRQTRWQRYIYAAPIAWQLWSVAASLPSAASIFQNDFKTLIVSDDVASLVGLVFTAIILLVVVAILMWTARRMWQPSRRIFDWLLGAAPLPRADIYKIVWLAALFLAIRLPSEVARYDFKIIRPSLFEQPASKVRAVDVSGPIGIGSALPDEEMTLHEQQVRRITTPSSLVVNLWLWDSLVSAPVGLPMEMIALDVGVLACILAMASAVRGCLWFIRKVMWRVATYSKGAWTAILALLTGLLIIASVLLTGH